MAHGQNFRALIAWLGSTHSIVTRAYTPEALSTGGDCYGTSWTAINYTKLYHPEPDYEVVTEAVCSRNHYHISKGQVTESSYLLAGHFLLSMPQDLSLVDPLWSTYTAETLGGFDPPIALTKAIALVPFSTTSPSSLSQAEPASTPTHFLPLQTSTSKPDAPAGDEPPAKGSGFDPSNTSADEISNTEKVLAPTLGSNSGLDPPDMGQEDTPIAASPQQGAGHEDPPNKNPQKESDIQAEGSPQIPYPAGQGHQSDLTAAGGEQDGGSDSTQMIDPYQESSSEEKDSPAVDTTDVDDPQEAST